MSEITVKSGQTVWTAGEYKCDTCGTKKTFELGDVAPKCDSDAHTVKQRGPAIDPGAATWRLMD